ncbi:MULTISPECIES: AAA family ATPase [unclassified Fusibacter]|uniref:AAA family ATPase n=1 Tax=unclassified Fusibacter TaxID=2624464 RepID=UPI00101026A1|nr:MULTISPECIES: AAA family ATPase [unclassified Fusibacter]MCK8060129.1 AAA family ATPase [Fusibacter sp. A2]NPE22271.1 AAA family ATPase [Fusibacter sp. A1]RXV61044.1 shikimate kinase [Fusibacter sp. A1]
MKFVLITGPQAVGKMTVGMSLAEKTGLKLFHNHMTIELALQFFDYATKEAQHIIHTFRKELFKTMAESDGAGMIFTYVWAFNLESEYEYVKELLSLFEKNGAQTYIVELEADLETRIDRNMTPLRLQEKASKRDTQRSHNELVKSLEKYRLNSEPGEVDHNNYLRINNSKMTPEAVADKIIEFFEF